jgi:hypothetical protein
LILIDSVTEANGRVVAAVARRFGQGGLLGSPGSWTSQRGALWRYHWPTVAQTQKSPPRQCRAGLERKEEPDATWEGDSFARPLRA